MGTINSLGGYYPLSSLLSSGSGSSLSSSQATSQMQSLAQMLAEADSSGSGSGDSSYLLDLSPQAQQLMSGNPASASSAGGSSGNFILTQAQQTAIQNIIEKYKNAPLDQATFDSIQNALQAAGLSPQTLGAEDQVNSFNPTNVLLQALSGNYASIQTPDTTQSDEQTKEANYMQSIVNLWKADSAAASSASGSASSGSGTTGT